MSELKADKTFVFGEECEAYKKSEADKVIEDKDAKILALDAEVFKQKHHAKLFFDERNYAETQLRRQKYKRCLAMANGCKDKIKYWHIRYETAAGYDRSYEKRKHKVLKKWLSRWLAIADKFKPNSTAQ